MLSRLLLVLKDWSSVGFAMQPRGGSRDSWGQEAKRLNGALQESEVQDLEGYPLPSLLADLPSPGRHISWQAAVAWLVAAVTLAGTGVKHLEGWPVARGARVSCPRRKSSTATTPCTTAVSHSSGCTFAGTISGGAILTRNRAGCTGTLVPARAGLGGRGRGRRWQWLGHSGSWRSGRAHV